MKSIRKTFIILLASAGIRIDKITDGRVDALFFIVIGYASHLLFSKYVGFGLAVSYFFVLFFVRYVFLFGSFVKNGFSDRLIHKYGEKKAWDIYELLTAVMFFQRGLSFGLLTEATKWDVLSISYFDGNTIALKYICMGLGTALVVIGFIVNTTATFVIGIDTYYYKDLFLKRPVVDFKVEGPYKYFKNPMYGIGQASGYGVALMVGSIEGVLATLLNQIMMYVFYYAVEKPHIVAMFTKPTLFQKEIIPAKVKSYTSSNIIEVLE